MKSQTKNSSYKKLFSLLKNSDDFYEIEVLTRIKEDFEKMHAHDLCVFEKLFQDQNIKCPKCGSNNYIKNGKDKTGLRRFICKNCRKEFNVLSNTLFSSSKVNMRAWFAFLESLLSGSSIRVACIVAKISFVTGTKWINKIFKTLKTYQETIVLKKKLFIDETYVHEDKSKIYYFDEIGVIKKIRKQPRGISRNKICILAATDETKSFAEIVTHGRPNREINYSICKKHIKNNSYVIGDEDNSLTYTSKLMNWNRTQIKAYTEEAFSTLKPIDDWCNRFKFFINKHRGFKKNVLQDYINLFVYIDNEMFSCNDIYKVTIKLLKLMFSFSKI